MGLWECKKSTFIYFITMQQFLFSASTGIKVKREILLHTEELGHTHDWHKSKCVHHFISRQWSHNLLNNFSLSLSSSLLGNKKTRDNFTN